jgi:hypothetical protein
MAGELNSFQPALLYETDHMKTQFDSPQAFPVLESEFLSKMYDHELIS